MKARARAVVEAGGVLRELHSQPPLTLRRLADPDPGRCALALVGSAAGPLDGDDLGLQLEIGASARASLVAAGATIALGQPDHAQQESATLSTEITVADGGQLTGAPGALIVTAGARLDVQVYAYLAADAELRWTELVVLGRTGEAPGAVRISWQIERAGAPLLRQTTDLTEAALRQWPGMIAGARVLATTVRVGPNVIARTEAISRRAARHALAPDAELITVLAADAVSAQRQLEQWPD